MSRINEKELQVVWSTVSLLRQNVNARDWDNASKLYVALRNYEDNAINPDVRLINIAREGCEYYTEKYNQWLKDEVFRYA